VCDLETSRMGAPYIYDISRLRVKTTQQRQAIYTDQYAYMHTKLTNVHNSKQCSH